MAEKIALRPALPADVPALAALFRASVEAFGPDDYSDAQVEAWSAQAEDEAAFAESLAGKITILGVIGGVIAGFATLKGTDILDMLYVHPNFARRGVATQLCDAMEKLSQARKATVLTADVSDCAQVFFVKRGYEPQRRNTVFVGDEILGNTTMTRRLPALTGKTQ